MVDTEPFDSFDEFEEAKKVKTPIEKTKPVEEKPVEGTTAEEKKEKISIPKSKKKQ